MNKKKSKALAFLLAASLLVPSTNGIVSAAELKNDLISQNQEINQNQEISNETVATIEGTEYKTLEEAISKVKNNQTIKIVKNINIEKKFNLADKTNVTIEGVSINGKKPVISIDGKKADFTFTVGEGFKIKNLELKVTGESLQDTIIEVEKNKGIKEICVEECDFTVSKECTYITNLIQANNCALVLMNNTVKAPANRAFVNPSNNSKIIGNTIDLMESGAKNAAISFSGKIDNATIEGNTFLGMDRGIAFDSAETNGENIKIKGNKFYEIDWAYRVDLKKNNKGGKFDFSGNYYEKNGKASNVKVKDDTTGSEVDFDSYKDSNIVVWPVYSDANMNNTISEGVAKVNDKDYLTLEKAIKAAKEGNTVTLLKDIDVDTWNQIWNIKGITLDGNGKTIKVNKRVESNGNHDAILHSDGGNTFKNIKIDLSTVNERSNIEGIRAIDAGDGDVIDNVTIIGGEKISYGITAGNSKNLTIINSTISNCGHGVYLEGANDTTVLIKDNTFDGCEYASILYSKNAKFEGNTVKGGKVNIMHESNVVQKNTFTQDNSGKASRIKFYTEGNEKTFKYNKLTEGANGEIGSTITFATASDTGKDAVDSGNVDFSLNYLGDKEKFDKIINGASKEVIGSIKNQAFDKASDVDNYLNEGSNIPSKPIKPTYDHTSIIGSDRYETAGKIADKLGSYDTAVLVNATSTMSDGLSAAGLAGKEDAAILLVKKDSIPKATMDRLSKVKKVYIIGGENAISQKVVNQLKKNNVKVNVERLGGKTRVETSELVAKKLGNYKKAFVVNGFKGEADAMSASSVAAKNGAPILLTNGKTSTHAKKSGVSYYVVGGNNVVNKSIANKYNAEVLAGDDRYETNREVINEFYGESETLYFANGETLVDALTASTLSKDDGLVLVGRKSDNKILNKKNTIQVGGMKFDVDFEK